MAGEGAPSTSQGEVSKVQVTLTERAASKVRELMTGWGDDLYLRLLVRKSGSGIAYDLVFERAPRPTDATLTVGGIRILVDPSSGELADGCSIDFLSHPAGFAVHNPHAGAAH